MAILNKIDSNSTGLSYTEEASIGVLKAVPVFIPLEPNSYSDFGGELTTLARNPINSSRQRKFGVVVDLDASGGLNTDLTQTNLQDLLQGFMFASHRAKQEIKNTAGDDTEIVSIDAGGIITFGTADPSTVGFVANQLVHVTGFPTAANNGLFYVVAVTATTMTIGVADGAKAGAATTTAETASAANFSGATAGSAGSVVAVGYEFAAGEVDVTAGAGFPVITMAAAGHAALNLIPGEWIHVGGDAAGLRLTTALDVNSGFMRVRAVDATADTVSIDKSQFTLATEADATQTVQVFTGRMLKNELGALITRRTYQLQRTLGKPDDTDPLDQSEYIVGAVPSEITINMATADKVNLDLSFVGTDNEQRTSTTGPKSKDGTLNSVETTLVESDAFNTSSDFTRIKMAIVDPADSAPSALFAFATDVSLTINNNVSPNKAIGCLGAFEVTAGTFEVGGDITAYFSDIAAVTAVRNNSQITLDMHLVKANAGITIDVPLLSLGDGRANIEQDEPITLPLSNQAATAAKIDSTLDYTLSFTFWDFLPTFADQSFC